MDLHTVRRAAGLSQSALAAQTGISRPRLSAAECGYLELSEEEIANIRAAVAAEPERRAARIRQALAPDGGPNWETVREVSV